MDDELLGYFITWTCYGTWLPGDERGWTKWHEGEQQKAPPLASWCMDQMAETPLYLSKRQREIVNQTVEEHCLIRRWILHAVNCRSNHCHTVVTAPGYAGNVVRDQLKGWATRKLKDEQRLSDDEILREHWWTAKGSVRPLNTQDSVDAAVIYTYEAQDFGGSKNL